MTPASPPPAPMTDVELDALEDACNNSELEFGDAERLIAQAREANALREALKEVLDNAGPDALGVWKAWTDYQGQVEGHKCNGCSAECTSKWPDWKLDFKHAPGCKYVFLMSALLQVPK